MKYSEALIFYRAGQSVSSGIVTGAVAASHHASAPGEEKPADFKPAARTSEQINVDPVEAEKQKYKRFSSLLKVELFGTVFTFLESIQTFDSLFI